jgi:hypothetical protein
MSPPDAAWVSKLSGLTPSLVTGALMEASREASLTAHLDCARSRGNQIPPTELDSIVEMYALTRLLRPRHAVEVGVHSGAASAYILQALERNRAGTLHSIQYAEPELGLSRGQTRSGGSAGEAHGQPPGWAVPLPLKRRWDLRLGDKAEILPLLGEELPHIDLFVYHAPHSDPGALREFQSIDRRLAPGAVAIADHGRSKPCCPSLARWAKNRRETPLGRRGLGAYGFRCA